MGRSHIPVLNTLEPASVNTVDVHDLFTMFVPALASACYQEHGSVECLYLQRETTML